MARLIDADLLKEEIQRYADAEETKSIINTGGSIMSWEHRQVLMAITAMKVVYKIMDNMPTVEEAVIPVRCKDCKYSRELYKGEKKLYVDGVLKCMNPDVYNIEPLPVWDTHYCACGIRREDEI